MVTTAETLGSDICAAARTLSASPLAVREALRPLRAQLVIELLETPDASIEAAYRGSLRDAARAVLTSSLHDLDRSPEERALAARVAQELGAALRTPERIARPLIASMFAGHAFEFPLPDDLFVVPRWLRAGFLRHQQSAPNVFAAVGDADAYLVHTTSFVERMALLVHELRDLDIIPKMFESFVGSSSFLQAYFNDRDVAPLYRARGRVLSAYARTGSAPTLYLPGPISAPPAKMRVGIFATSFGPTTETYFNLAQFEHLDRSRIEVRLYRLVASGTPIESVCEAFADVVTTLPSTTAAAVELLRNDALDVLFLSTNMTVRANDPAILGCYRMAPIQIVTACSPVTSGACHADVYLLGEWNETKPGAASRHSETLVTIPESITVYAYQHDHAERTTQPTRAELGITESATVLFSGANYFKIVPELSRDWARILAGAPGSVLVLMPFNPNWSDSYFARPLVDRLFADLAAHGVDRERVKLLSPVRERADVHAILGLADVYLDPYPFAGACSMLDALWTAVPPVARTNGLFRGSVGASMLKMVGLSHLATESSDAYVALGVRLATDENERAEIRAVLERVRAEEPPCYMDSRTLSARVGDAALGLAARRRRLFDELSSLPLDEVRQVAQRLFDQALESSDDAAQLTDSALVHAFVEPFFLKRVKRQAGVMIDVGACVGEMSAAFAAAGWSVTLFEPDPAPRATLEQRFAGKNNVVIEAQAVTLEEVASVSFHKAATQGLSGLAQSPFGATEAVLEVPAVRLGAYCRARGIGAVDFLKVDAEGHDFEAMASFDFEAIKPRLVLVEFQMSFATHSPQAVAAAIAAMASHGYRAVVFNYTDNGLFERGIFHYRLVDVGVDRPLALDAARKDFGNILFYRADDREFLVALCELIEPCRPRSRAFEKLGA